MKKYTVLISILLISSSAAYADIIIQSPTGNLDCKQIIANWSGSATVGPCGYSGSVGVTGDGPTFTANIDANKTSGLDLCPKTITRKVPGKCQADTGKITMASQDVSLSGKYDGGTKLNLTGKIKGYNATVKLSKGSTMSPKLTPLTPKLIPLQQKIK